MNKHILVGIRVDDSVHKVILDGVAYLEIKKRYNEIRNSTEFSKVEIWSRANGLEKSKRLKPKADVAEDIPEDTISSIPNETGDGEDDIPDPPIPEDETLDEESEDESSEESDAADFDSGTENDNT